MSGSSGRLVPSASAKYYGALADTTYISNLTSYGSNACILYRLKNNDRSLRILKVGGDSGYILEGASSMGVLGYYLGRSTNVATLTLSLPEDLDSGIIEPFLSGLQSNKSIRKVHLHLPGDFGDFRMLAPFVRDNPNLGGFYVERCPMDAEQYRSLSSALREGNSLKYFSIGRLVGDGHYGHEESIIANIEALKMHPQLERIAFQYFSLGRNVCRALSDLFQQSAAGMQLVHLSNNRIDDAGLEALVDGLAHCGGLRHLDLSRSPAITVRGWRALATLLEDPNSSLERLHLHGNDINDESAIFFANALAHNNSLQWLYLHSNVDSTGEGWKEAFSKLLCDTSSANSTFLSNHTLRYLTAPSRGDDHLPGDIRSSLRLNQDDDKRRVAFRKVLLFHDDLDMQPLFEWDLKMLPLVVEWLERAAAYGIEHEGDNRKRKLAAIYRFIRGKMKLSAVYRFVRGMPELVVEGIMGVNKSAQTVGAKRLHSTAFEGGEGHS